jgi:BirA family biotin operon repressor/biotin-[acetyl-CoA-carboxylase] ligase
VGGLPPVQLKWPNDVLVAGRKLGGILCEARWHGAALGWVVIGLGLNVANAPPAGVRVPAAALIEWRPDLTAATLAQPMASALAVLDGGSRLAAGELAAWRARDGLAGRRLRAPVAGTVQGLADDGALEVAGPHGVERIAPGDTAALELA